MSIASSSLLESGAPILRVADAVPIVSMPDCVQAVELTLKRTRILAEYRAIWGNLETETRQTP
jgi:hypothetical protein